jgi:hypothetical protein
MELDKLVSGTCGDELGGAGNRRGLLETGE